MAGLPTIHPLKSIEKRIADMLAAGASVEKVSKLLEMSEMTIRKYYGYVLEKHGVRPGPPEHEATDANRRIVRGMMIAGYTQDDVAKVLEISPMTLRKYYREDLDQALIRINTQIANNLAQAALGDPTQKTTVTAGIYWTKVRMGHLGWKEVSRVEQTGANGGPIESEQRVVVILPDNNRGKTIIDAQPEPEAESNEVDALVLPDLSDNDDDDC